MNTAQETLALLRAPVPEELISTKQEEGRSTSYIAWYDLIDLLSDRTDGL